MEQNNIDIIPKSFKLQWHITERCNFRCKHCYQDNYDTPEMSLDQMEEVIKQFVNLTKKWNLPRERCRITITGGEPFLHKDFFPFLAKIYKHSRYLIWAPLSNGSLLTRDNVKILKLFKVSNFQVSLEGLEETNDKIRGKGAYKKTIEALKILNYVGISTSVSLTATKENLEDIMPLAEVLAKLKVRYFHVRRLVPWGVGAKFADALLEPQKMEGLYKKIKKENSRLFQKYPGFFMPQDCDNCLFWSSPDSHCAVISGEIIALLPNGDILPCRRLPIKVGNILETPLEELYYCDKMQEFRDIKKTASYCQGKCSDFKKCLGGAKCVTYAVSKRLDIPDVQCPKIAG